MVRGGSWNNNRRNARAAVRNRNDPANFNNNIGFRVARSHALDFAGSARRRRARRRPRLKRPGQLPALAL
ncbi:MAG: SUMF1/EgtB/PvdO family nonheme iron enzyme [Chloroflexota bacterium]